jgi:hypothetical protein
LFKDQILKNYKDAGHSSIEVKAKAGAFLITLVRFKDLKKGGISLEATQQLRLFEWLRNKPFWIWNIEEHKHKDVKTKGHCYLIMLLVCRQKRVHKPC